MIRRVFVTGILGLIASIGFSQNFDKTTLDDYFTALEKTHKFMGSVAISKNGSLIYTRSIGWANIGNHMQASAGSTYRIGSISKTFTSVLVFKAVEQNKVYLDQTIESFFPTFPTAKKITINHLLRHRSGIHNFTDDRDYLTWNTQPRTEEEMINMIARGGSDFEPGSRAAYSNSNYVLLTFILEKIFNKPYSQLLTEYITQPLGLKNTYFGSTSHPKKSEAKSYRYINQWEIEPETDLSIPQGAGSIISTPADIIQFGEALFAGKIISPENVARMQVIQEGYGIWACLNFHFMREELLGTLVVSMASPPCGAISPTIKYRLLLPVMGTT